MKAQYTISYLKLSDKWRSVAYLQKDFGDDGVDVKHSVQVKTQELLTAPDRENYSQEFKRDSNTIPQ